MWAVPSRLCRSCSDGRGPAGLAASGPVLGGDTPRLVAGVVGAGFLQVWDQLQPPVVGVLEGSSPFFGYGRRCRPVVGSGCFDTGPLSDPYHVVDAWTQPVRTRVKDLPPFGVWVGAVLKVGDSHCPFRRCPFLR